MLAEGSKLLLLAEKGKFHEYAGKSLDEIELSPDDTVEAETEEDDEDEDVEEEAMDASNDDTEVDPPDDERGGAIAGPSTSRQTQSMDFAGPSTSRQA